MRKIKFRAWDNIQNRMILSKEIHWMEFIGNSIWLYDEGELSLGETDNVELMQFTGLTDKNDREIYEGDIVEYDWFTKKQIKAEVKYINNKMRNGFYVIYKSKPTQNYWRNIWYLNEIFLQNNSIEIIGNIYENPELLERS